jgi:hypothetical protein
MSQATVTITISITRHRRSLLAPRVHKFVSHKDFICYYSPFFSAAFNGKFEEGNTQKMELDDVDPEVFGILADWVYSQEVTDAERKTPDLVTCAKLWVLGGQFLMKKLQNDTIKQIYAILNPARSRGVPIKFGEFCRIAADTKPEDNPLFKIAVNMLSSDKKVPTRFHTQSCSLYPRISCCVAKLSGGRNAKCHPKRAGPMRGDIL